MRDYRFGEWLTSLRISNGYSQFQLGKLLGVSDKAVSKWETGASKPRTETCAKIASLFGISLDDLLSCRKTRMSGRLYSGQSEAEESLWEEARQKLRAIYGENPPLAFLSRLDAEEILMRGTGTIQHLKLIGGLWRRRIRFSDYFDDLTSLTAWLMGAVPFNPLPPHTVCPRCKAVMLHTEAADGWDLPEEICACGSPLKRDGHDIPLDLCEKRFVDRDCGIHIDLPEAHKPALMEMIGQIYQNRWTLLEYQCSALDEPHAPKFNDHVLHHYLLVPDGTTLPYPVSNGIYQLPKDDFEYAEYYDVTNLPEAVVFLNTTNWKKTSPPQETVFPTEKLLKREILDAAREKFHILPGATKCKYEDRSITLGLSYPPKDDSIESPPCDKTDEDFPAIIPRPTLPDGSPGKLPPQPKLKEIVYQYQIDDIGRYISEHPKFSEIVRYVSLCDIMTWNRFVGNVVKNGSASLAEIPPSMEDVFEMIRRKAREMGIRDKGIAQKVIAEIEYEALSEETLREVSALGFPAWFTDYLNFIVSNGLGSKENLIISAYGLLHKIAKKKWIGIWGAKSYDSSQRDKALQIAMDERLAEGSM